MLAGAESAIDTTDEVAAEAEGPTEINIILQDPHRILHNAESRYHM